MKKLILWVLMVALFLALLLGGAVFAFYQMTDLGDLPDGRPTLGEATLEPIGYDWQAPVLGGVIEKRLYQAPTLTVQKLGTLAAAPALSLPEGQWDTALTLTGPAGTQLFSGTAEEFESYVYTANGDYVLKLELTRRASDEAQPYGAYYYQAGFTLALQPEATLSSSSVAQGGIAALLITGILDGGEPSAETDLGAVWFRSVADGWMGYIPVTYNAETGEHTITVTCGAQQIPVTLTVTPRQSSSVPDDSQSTETDASAAEYRNAIWPLFTTGSGEKAWQGTFRAPVSTGVLASYGATLTRDGTPSGRATGITYSAGVQPAEVCAPQAGTVEFAGTLAMTGGTVVIDHGCGVKSYLYGMESILVEKGQQLAVGDALGTAAAVTTAEDGTVTQPLYQFIWEMRIGSKTVDPALAESGTSGLQYREDL